MHINFDELSTNQRYHLLTQTIVPRPIAWVLSRNSDETLNLAPFSFFNAMCSDPPLLALSIGNKEKGIPKDTAVNLLSGREFVIHIASTEMAAELTKTAATLEYGESELQISDLQLSDDGKQSMPRLSDCGIAYHCKLYDHHSIGPSEQTIIYAEVISLYMNDAICEIDGTRITVDANRLNPLSRLGAAQYAGIEPAFTVKRPK